MALTDTIERMKERMHIYPDAAHKDVLARIDRGQTVTIQRHQLPSLMRYIEREQARCRMHVSTRGESVTLEPVG